MKVSIITAVMNRADTIEHAIESVQSQSHRDLEHVIQDGGSQDGTVEIIERLSGSQTRLVSEPDAGIYDAINRGIARSTGDVVGLLHSDDFFPHQDVVSHIAAAFGDPTIDAVYGDLDYVSARDPDRVIRRWRAGIASPAKLRRGWMPPHPTLYLRASVFRDHGVYDTSFEIAADYDAVLRYFSTGKIRSAYLTEVLVKMRLGGASNASLRHLLRKSQEDLRALRQNGIGGYGTLVLKNVSKLGQFVLKGS
ncbi:MAG: glycosyltransferase family 2 protein [Caldilineaceae bacterium]